jgi:hypothetical protein
VILISENHLEKVGVIYRDNIVVHINYKTKSYCNKNVVMLPSVTQAVCSFSRQVW